MLCWLLAASWFIAGLAVGHVLTDRRLKRNWRCGALAPVDAELGMATCIARHGHEPPHVNRRGETW